MKRFVILHGAFADAAYFQEKLVSVCLARPRGYTFADGCGQWPCGSSANSPAGFEQRLCLIRFFSLQSTGFNQMCAFWGLNVNLSCNVWKTRPKPDPSRLIQIRTSSCAPGRSGTQQGHIRHIWHCSAFGSSQRTSGSAAFVAWIWCRQRGGPSSWSGGTVLILFPQNERAHLISSDLICFRFRVTSLQFHQLSVTALPTCLEATTSAQCLWQWTRACCSPKIKFYMDQNGIQWSDMERVIWATFSRVLFMQQKVVVSTSIRYVVFLSSSSHWCHTALSKESARTLQSVCSGYMLFRLTREALQFLSLSGSSRLACPKSTNIMWSTSLLDQHFCKKSVALLHHCHVEARHFGQFVKICQDRAVAAALLQHRGIRSCTWLQEAITHKWCVCWSKRGLTKMLIRKQAGGLLKACHRATLRNYTILYI